MTSIGWFLMGFVAAFAFSAAAVFGILLLDCRQRSRRREVVNKRFERWA